MSKFAVFCAKPITWGAYFKLCGIAMAMTAAYTIPLMIRIRKDFDKW